MKAGRSLLFSASLLTLANLIGRSLGLVYRAFLSRYLGAEGMGLYQTMTAFCYSLVNPASAGLTVGVSQVIASKDPVSHSRMAAAPMRAEAIITLMLKLSRGRAW